MPHRLKQGRLQLAGRLERLANACILLTGWQRYFAAFAAGLLTALTMPPVDFPLIAFFTFPVMVWLMDGVYGDSASSLIGKIKSAFLPGWWFGFGYFLAGLWWIGSAFLVEADDFLWALPFAVLGFPAFLAIFWGFATLFSRLLWSEGWLRVFGFAAAFALMEYLRGTLLTGFPWNTIGYAAMIHPVLMQVASLIGLFGVTLLALLAFAIPLVVLATPKHVMANRLLPLAFVALLLAGQVGFGVWRFASHLTDYVDDVNLRLVNPAIPQKTKFDPDREEEIIATYLELSGRLLGEENKSLENTQYLIWPESVFPFLVTERRDVLSAIAELLPPGTQLITGAMRAEPGTAGDPYGKIYNSVLLIDENGEIAAAADKTHLVPFGEYLPFQAFLESLGLEQLTRLRGGFEQGAERNVISGKAGGAFLPLICYEIIFSGEILDTEIPSDANAGGAKWIVNLTNDAWFGRTPGPWQHLRQSVVRAVEEGLPVVRVANRGISGVIDPYGRLRATLPIDEASVTESALPKPSEETVFSRYRNQPFFLLLIISLVISMFSRLRRVS